MPDEPEKNVALDRLKRILSLQFNFIPLEQVIPFSIGYAVGWCSGIIDNLTGRILVGVVFVFLHTLIHRYITKNKVDNTFGPEKYFVSCWPQRPDAYEEIKKDILGVKHSIFVAGTCLTTLTSILSHKQVRDTILAKLRDKGSNFQFTIITVKDISQYSTNEEGRRSLQQNIENGRRILTGFLDYMRAEGASEEMVRKIDIRTYKEGVMPRHLIVKIDESVYVGSYLCKLSGASSYLLKMKTQAPPHDLTVLFNEEIAYLRTESEPCGAQAVNYQGV